MKYFFIAILLFSNICHAQISLPSSLKENNEEIVKKLQWNRYEIGKFSILSIDDAQGKWLGENIEKIKHYSMHKWGFNDFKFSKECRIFCVPSESLLKTLFGINESRIEIREDLTVMWLVLNDTPKISVYPYVEIATLSEYANAGNIYFKFWFKRACFLLNKPKQDSKSLIKDFNTILVKNDNIFTIESILNFTESDYNKQTPINKKIFDQQVVILCLMLRKEFGEIKFKSFLKFDNKGDGAIRVVYKYKSYLHFEEQYIKYSRDLTKDVLNNRMPDFYLEIENIGDLK